MISSRSRALKACIAVGMAAAISACGTDGQTLIGSEPSVADAAEKPGVSRRALPGAPAVKAPASMTPVAALTQSPNGRYYVHFKEPSLAGHFGELKKALPKGKQRAALGARMNVSHPTLAAYKAELELAQELHIETIRDLLGRETVLRTFTVAVNAVVIEASLQEAKSLAAMPSVAFIEPDHRVDLLTDVGPAWIGATNIWDGSASGVASQGEGMVVGIIDTGIAFNVDIDGTLSEHPSFSATADDGYVHQNPLGAGNFLGACGENPGWCNDKLIGHYSFLDGQGGVDPFAPDDAEIYSFKDIDGHGSHVASTSAGNPLTGVPLLDADGNPSPDFSFDRISGVAPRANLVNYKVCSEVGCYTGDIIAAVEQAIEDSVVDVLNHSIDSMGGSPWQSGQAMAFLAARQAGIFVATSAGNSGPDAATIGAANAPWAAGVAATTHDRYYEPKELTDLAGGDTEPPATISGFALTRGFEGRIVYAGNYAFGEAGTPGFDTPALCAVDFPAGTFEADMIVLCDRGAVARVAKGQAVRAGGGGGFILANVADGAGSTDPDAHVIPAIHVDATAGDALRLWLATGEGHMGRITAADQPSSNPDAADIVAFFSSRGPYPTYDFLGPNVAAPGVAIFAAGSGYAGGNSVPGMFGPVSGTSMATPHIAGAAALIKAVHPEWTDAEVLSAMITTGVNTLRKEDGVTPADIHDIGGGRISLADAVRAGLVLDETVEGFLAQNPAQDGDPGALNIAELVRQTCVVRCGWERTVKATVDGSWTITAPDYITVTPAEFTLAAGETQALSIEVYSAEMPVGEYVFGQVGLIPADGSLPDQHIPAVVRSAGSTLPLRTQVVATRSQGSTVIAGIESLGIDEFTYVVKGVSTAEQQELSVAQDSDNGSAYDDVTDGVATVLVPFPDGAEQFIVEIAKSESPDLDLRVGLDFNGDGLPSQDEQFCSAATPSAIELCAFNLGGTLAGWPPFWISVQNWQASAEDAVDAFTLAVTAVSTEDTGMLTVSAPDSVIAGEPWDLSLNWTSPGEQGAIGYGVVSVYRTAEQTAASLLGTFDLRMVREADDVSTKLPDLVSARTAFPVEVVIGPNYENVPRNYEIYLPLPEGVSYVDGSGGTLVGNEVVIDVSKDVGDTTSTTLAFEARVRSSLAGETVTFTANNVVDNANTVTETTTADVDVSAYVFSGFLNPTKPDSTVIAGRPALLRFRLTDGSRGGFLTDEEVALRVTNDIGDIMVEDTFKSVFLFGYVHALNTREYDEGTYTVTAILPDGSEHSMPLNVKKWRWFH